jgi:hypothetical protein
MSLRLATKRSLEKDKAVEEEAPKKKARVAAAAKKKKPAAKEKKPAAKKKKPAAKKKKPAAKKKKPVAAKKKKPAAAAKKKSKNAALFAASDSDDDDSSSSDSGSDSDSSSGSDSGSEDDDGSESSSGSSSGSDSGSDDDDSGDSDEEKEYSDEYDADLFKKDDPEDRAHILSLPTVQQQQIFGERSEERTKNKGLWELKQALKKKKPKKKEPAAGRRSTRATKSTENEKRREAMAKLREKKRRQLGIASSESSAESSSSGDDDDSDYSDDERPKRGKRKKTSSSRRATGVDEDGDVIMGDASDPAYQSAPPKAEEQYRPAKYRDIVKALLPRKQLFSDINQPWFKKAAVGRFVRAYHRERKKYVLLRVRKVISKGPKVYKILAEDGIGQVISRVVLDLCLHPGGKGMQTTMMPYRIQVRGELVSNTKCTEEEFNSYMKKMKNQIDTHGSDLFKFVSDTEANNAKSKYKLLRKEYTSERSIADIAKQVNRNLQQRKTTINLTSAMIEAKADLEKALLDSHEPAASGESMDDKRSRDEEEIAKARAAVAKLQSEDNVRKDNVSKKDLRTSKINKRNQLGNIDRMDFAKTQVQQQQEAGVVNPFMRRPTRPSILWELGDSAQAIEEAKRKAEEAKQAEEEKKAKAKADAEAAALAGANQRKSTFDLHNFNLPNEDDLPFTVAATTKASRPKAPMRDGVMSLKQYLKMK